MGRLRRSGVGRDVQIALRRSWPRYVVRFPSGTPSPGACRRLRDRPRPRRSKVSIRATPFECISSERYAAGGRSRPSGRAPRRPAATSRREGSGRRRRSARAGRARSGTAAPRDVEPAGGGRSGQGVRWVSWSEIDASHRNPRRRQRRRGGSAPATPCTPMFTRNCIRPARYGRARSHAGLERSIRSADRRPSRTRPAGARRSPRTG